MLVDPDDGGQVGSAARRSMPRAGVEPARSEGLRATGPIVPSPPILPTAKTVDPYGQAGYGRASNDGEPHS